jgi:hypothetical protein
LVGPWNIRQVLRIEIEIQFQLDWSFSGPAVSWVTVSGDESRPVSQHARAENISASGKLEVSHASITGRLQSTFSANRFL